jgi:DNA-directed RNA polymerase specialized sigma24 family protein
VSTPGATDVVDERERMADALAWLPAHMRAVLVLRYTEDLSETDTAEFPGCSVP